MMEATLCCFIIMKSIQMLFDQNYNNSANYNEDRSSLQKVPAALLCNTLETWAQIEEYSAWSYCVCRGEKSLYLNNKLLKIIN